MTKDYSIQTVQNAMQILRLFNAEKDEWTLTEIAQAKAMSISTTKRLLDILEVYGYLTKGAGGLKKYRLGLSVLKLSGIVKTRFEITKEAQQLLNKLLEDFVETVHIGVLEGTHTVYLDKLDSRYPVHLSTYIGKQSPVYCTGCGKVMMAFKNKKEQDEIIQQIVNEGFYPFTSKTVRNAAELREHLLQIKKQGYAASTDEYQEGITSIAAPIYDYNDTVAAAISVTGPTKRMEIPEIIEGVVKTANEFSKSMGYIPN
ncbi:IclR family transcriptional regulator [Lysinibacillus yapensis]|uniref:IclR family transcriptional regulator n=1 Tax=Ureibacillus yapensis TaxID=2304605 RepID=A0A396SIP4_9BACL|nr:IclR family transcriptional regulator [Lysinibacillus yapensis]RHW38595.1 IclR family transcriptional regulator [Lysinibacillus yapensis]